MFIVKVVAVYVIILMLSIIRAGVFRLLFGDDTSAETDRHYELITAILFAAFIIREGLW